MRSKAYSSAHPWTIALVLALGAVTDASAATVNSVSAVDSREQDGVTTIRVRGSGTPTFTVYKLEDPDRVVVDLSNAELSADLTRAGDGKAVWQTNTWGVSSVTGYSPGSGNRVRVVVQLARKASYNVRGVGRDVEIVVTPRDKQPASSMSAAELAAQKRALADQQQAIAAQRQATRQEAERLEKARAEMAAESERARAERARAEELVKAAEDMRKRATSEIADARREVEAARAEATKAKADAVTRSRDADERRRSADAMLSEARARLAEAESARKAAEAAKASADERARKATTDAERKEAAAQTRVASKNLEDAKAEARAAEDNRRLAEARRKQADDARRLAEERRAAAEKEAEAAEARVAELRNTLEETSKRVETARALRAREEKSFARAEAARAAAEERQRAAADAAARVEASLRAIRDAEKAERESHRAAEDARATLSSYEGRKNRNQQELETLRQQAARLAAQRDAARKSVAAQQRELEVRRAKAAELGAQRDKALAELEMVRRRTADSASARQAEEAKLAALATRRHKAEAEYTQLRADMAAAQASRLEAEKKLAEARARQSDVEKSTAETLARTRAELAKARKEADELEARRRALTAEGDSRPRVQEVDYQHRADEARIVLGVSSPTRPRVIENRGKRAVLLMDGVGIDKKLERTIDATRFGGPVKSVSAYRDPKNPANVRVVVDLDQPTQGVLKRVGTTYYWDFPIRKEVAKAGDSRRAPRAASVPSPVLASAVSNAPITQASVSQNRNRKVYRGRPIDLDFKDADIHNLLRLLADVGGVNIVIPDEIKASVTVRLRRVPWDQAMEVILASKGLWYRRQGDLIRVAPRKDLEAEDKAEAERRLALVQAEAPEPEVFTLNYADARQIRRQLQPLVSPKGRVEVDLRTNSIIINDVRAHRRRIIDMVRRLDSQTPQIQIEARIVEARTNFVREFGIQWGGNFVGSAATGNATGLTFPNSVAVAGGADDAQTAGNGVRATPTDFAVNLPAAVGSGSGGALGFAFGSVGGNFNLNVRLSALEDVGTVRIVSSPKITVVNNVQARISQGVSIPISVVSANGVQTQFIPADLALQITPHVSQRDCSISMDVNVTNNQPDFANTGARGDPSILRREAQTTVLVADGETTVIGGIYTRNTARTYNKVPFLADLPVIGLLFKSRRDSDDRAEILIFLTPKITNRASLQCE